LLVDVQQDFFDRRGLSPSKAELIGQLQRLLTDWRQLARPVLHIRTRMAADGRDRMPHWRRQDIRACVAGTPGCEPPDGLAAQSAEPVLYKRFFSAFDCQELVPTLAEIGVETLVIAGLYTHGCIRATVLDAYARGFEVLVADDAIGSTEPLHAELSRDWLNGRAARFLPSSGLLTRAVDAERIRLADSARSAVAAACATAAEAGRRWASVEPAERAALLERWAQALERDTDALRRLLALEIGKPIAEAGDELRRTLAHIRLAAALAREALEEAPAAGVRVRYRPVGTIALITPWNNPLAIPAGKLAPALACGNGCVWKPSPRAPRCAAELHRALLDAGLPTGLVQLVAGDAETARDIAADPRIDAVALTGSNAAGRAISALCAARQKPLQAELGGNNAALILDDWDFDQAALAQLAQAAFGFAGQRCTALRRLIVQRGILARFTDAFAAAVRSLTVGDPLDPATRVGPLICADHRRQVQARLDAALADGAKLIAQAALPADADRVDLLGRRSDSSTDRWSGHWLPPSLLGDVDPDSPIVQQETFGPIAVILAADDLDQAIALANAVPQGLLAAVYSNDAAAKARCAEQVQAGMLKLGPGALAIAAEAPFCGWKASAIGPPEHGRWDRDFYAKAQTRYR